VPHSFVAIHKQPIRGYDDFSPSVFQVQQISEFPLYDVLVRQRVRDLDIGLLPVFFSDEIDFFFSDYPNAYGVSVRCQMVVDEIFVHSSYVVFQAQSDDGVSDSQVEGIYFFRDFEQLFSSYVVPGHFVEKIGIATEFHIVQYRFHRGFPFFVFQKISDIFGIDEISELLEQILVDMFQQARIPYVLVFHQVFHEDGIIDSFQVFRFDIRVLNVANGRQSSEVHVFVQ
jgi:hypothetical protein